MSKRTSQEETHLLEELKNNSSIPDIAIKRGEGGLVCKPVHEPEPYKDPIDPKTTAIGKKPEICPICGIKYDCKWESSPYSLEIYNKYYYAWYCAVCLDNEFYDC